MTKRAVIYARVSTDKQRDNYSIPSQIGDCLKYAEVEDYTIVGDRYVDPVTGYDTLTVDGSIPAFVDDYTSRELNRPALDAAFDYLERVGFDVLVVHALDRLARDPYIRQTLEIEIAKLGAKVDYVLGNYEETPEGEVHKDLASAFAKWENAKRVERSNRGKKEKAEKGLFVAGQPPFGYAIDKDAPGGLVIDDDQAETVRRIFDLYVNDNKSQREIVNILEVEGAITAKGNTEWGRSTVRAILNNSTYAGEWHYNKNKRNGNLLEQRSPEKWIPVTVTPIIDEWLFRQAERRLSHNKKHRRKQPKRFYLLSGMVFCRECERPYYAQTQLAGKSRRATDAQTYRHRMSEGHCLNRHVSARILEPIVWDEIREILLDPERLVKGYRQSLEQQQATTARQRAHLETLRSQLVKFDQQRANLNAMYIDPEIELTKGEYIEQKERIEKSAAETARDIDRLREELADIPTPVELESIEVFSQKIRARLEGNLEPPDTEKRKILDLLHVKVLIGEDGSLEVTGWFDNRPRVGLMPTSSTRYVRQLLQPLKRA
jgi:site-specific DNA recombinase